MPNTTAESTTEQQANHQASRLSMALLCGLLQQSPLPALPMRGLLAVSSVRCRYPFYSSRQVIRTRTFFCGAYKLLGRPIIPGKKQRMIVGTSSSLSAEARSVDTADVPLELMATTHQAFSVLLSCCFCLLLVSLPYFPDLFDSTFSGQRSISRRTKHQALRILVTEVPFSGYSRWKVSKRYTFTEYVSENDSAVPPLVTTRLLVCLVQNHEVVPGKLNQRGSAQPLHVQQPLSSKMTKAAAILLALGCVTSANGFVVLPAAHTAAGRAGLRLGTTSFQPDGASWGGVEGSTRWNSEARAPGTLRMAADGGGKDEAKAKREVRG